MKTKLIFLMIMGFIITSCSKSEPVVKEELVDCEALGKWNGYVPGCGCYGFDVGLSGKCIRRNDDKDPIYFGKGGFKFIHDSLLFTFTLNGASFIFFNDGRGSVGASKSVHKISTAKDFFSDNRRYANISFRARDWYTPPAIEGLYTQIVIDKEMIKSAPEELTFKVYHWSGNTASDFIIDRTILVLKKDLDRL